MISFNNCCAVIPPRILTPVSPDRLNLRIAAKRTLKNSSKLLEKIPKNLSLSNKGTVSSAASCSTLALKFNRWFHETEDFGGVEEVNAMTVSTIGLDGFPKSRVVLLKKFNEEGFIFYTNYNSEKGKAIQQNPNIGLSFFWTSLERQVIIKGITSL